MAKYFLAVLLLCLVSLPSMAQSYPKVEAFGGYQYLRLDGENLNGWNASVAGYVNKAVGVAADFSGTYKKISGVSVKTYSYTFGPVVSLNHDGKVNPFVHALFGGAHVGGSLGAITASTNGFTMMFGGGADVKLNSTFAFRVIQADWVYYHFSGSNVTKNARISTGIVARF